MRHTQKVLDDIRADRTRLEWRVPTPFIRNYEDATIDGNKALSISTITKTCTVWDMTQGHLMGFSDRDHPIFKVLSEKDIAEEAEGHPFKDHWPKIAHTVEETKEKLQTIYNDWLLSEARKKDEGEGL